MKFPVLLVVCSAAIFSESIEAAQKPNILFIYTDNHSDRTLSCDERTEPWARTPNRDRRAECVSLTPMSAPSACPRGSPYSRGCISMARTPSAWKVNTRQRVRPRTAPRVRVWRGLQVLPESHHGRVFSVIAIRFATVFTGYRRSVAGP